jgi:transcriptional regulator of acetoin/glycerol metabolism
MTAAMNEISTDDAPRFVRRTSERFWCLRVLFADGKGLREREVKRLDTDAETVIGRELGEGRAIVDDDAVSKVHARIRCSPTGQWQISDAGSTNGTFVDRTRVGRQWTPIGDNSVIAMGGTLLMLCHDGSLPGGERLGSMEGDAFATRRMFQQVRRAAKSEATVLLLGPSGSGKERCARAIHESGGGRTGRFVPINCAELPSSLAESELFGHVKGSFSGADRPKKGLFEQAHHGTLFLDEIGELPLELQSKLLRVLETREVRPVGSEDRPFLVDVRVIAATNRDLEKEVDDARFRLDLFHRLNHLPIRVPAVAERKCDIPRLAARALGESWDRLGFFVVWALLLHDWKGNVRELKNFVETKIGSDDPVDQDDVDEFIADHVPVEALETAQRMITAERLVTSLREHNGNVTAVGRDLGCHARTVKRKANDLRIDIGTFRPLSS